MENNRTQSSSATSSHRLNANDFYFGKMLGEGSFSCVYLAKEVRTSKKYAIKVCEKRLILREQKQEYVKREREVLNRLSGKPGFLGLYCTFQDPTKLYFVMTYACNGTLLSLLSRPSFNIDCARFYAAEMLLALETMHDMCILHRDIKPENILLDHGMHVLIADFGSSKLDYQEEEQQEEKNHKEETKEQPPPSPTMSSARKHAKEVLEKAYRDEDDDTDDTEDINPVVRSNKRRSFVGTAQYVSPEILTGTPSSPASDLWSYGCTIYQMVCGVPPFRAASEYLIFQKILRCQVTYGEGFDPCAKALIMRLLQIEQVKRLGARDNPRYVSIREHPFFKGIHFESLRSTQAPMAPSEETVLNGEGSALSNYFPEGMKPGLDDRQMTRLLDFKLADLELSDEIRERAGDNDEQDGGGSQAGYRGTGNVSSAFRSGSSSIKLSKSLTNGTSTPSFDGNKNETGPLSVWEPFAEGETILKYGYVSKRKGLFARRRMFLLTTGPRLIYIDPVNMVKKGEIPWSASLSVEAKNFKTFYVHTPNRTYYLEDPEGFALKWVDTINEVHRKAFLNSVSEGRAATNV